jgi:hypothetical protein
MLQGTIDTDNLDLPYVNTATSAYEQFVNNWSAEKELLKQEKKPSLIRALRKSFGLYYMLAGICK